MLNRSIACNVNTCKHHAGNENYCTLNSIQIVNHHNPAKDKEATDCGSFECK